MEPPLGWMRYWTWREVASASRETQFPAAVGREADAAHADHGVADVVEVGAEGQPAGGLGAFGAVDVVAGEGVAGEAEAGSAVTEFLLEEGAEGSGEGVAGGVRVAELDDADELGALGSASSWWS